MKRKVTLKNVKGSYDYLPTEQYIRNFIQDTLRTVFEKYSYKPLETPILCYYDLLAGKYSDDNDLLHEIYKLNDQGDRELGLRYDLTVPFAKCVAMQKDLRLPFKRYEIGKVFRDGPVKPGRDREFLQCDVDVVGLDGQEIEAELISIWLEGFKLLGIDIYIKYNSRNLLCGLINEIMPECTLEEVNSFITIVDKIDKLSKDEIISEFVKNGMNESSAKTLIEKFNLSLDEIEKNYGSSNNETLKKGINELVNLQNIFNKLEISEYTLFTPSLARGQDYYTGNIFEVYAKNGELACSLGGGGRYDNMITNFVGDGLKYPAVGISFGLTTIFEILKERSDFSMRSYVDFLIIPINTKVESMKLANDLRKLGLKVEVLLKDKKVNKAFEYADKENIKYVIVIGEDEIKNQKFKIKNISNGVEKEVFFNNLNDII